MRNFGKLTFLFILLCAALTASSCALFKGKPDPASGEWKGTWSWQLGKMKQPGDRLDCKIARTADNEWKAVFDASWGKTSKTQAQTGSFKVELLGHREGEKVVFGGDVDLGASSGGVFNWKGEIVGDTFSGTYTSKMVSGDFELKKVTPANGKK